MPKEVGRHFSRVAMDLFLPCLMLAGMGANLNPGALRDSWHLVVSSTLSIGLSNGIAWAFGWLLMRRDARAKFRPVQLAIAFPNALVVPLVLFDALCEQDLINSDFDGDSNECFDQATGMIFIFLAVWQVWFYAWGVYCFQNDNTLELSLTSQPAAVPSPTTTAGETATSSGGTDPPHAADPPRCRSGHGNGSITKVISSTSPPSSVTVSNSSPNHTLHPKLAEAAKVDGDRASEWAGGGAVGGDTGAVDPQAGAAAAAAGDETGVVGAGTESGTGATETGAKNHGSPVGSLRSRDVAVASSPVRRDQPTLMAQTEHGGGGDADASEVASISRRRKENKVVADLRVIEEGNAIDGGGARGSGTGDVNGGRGGDSEGPWEEAKHRAWALLVSPVIVAVVAGIVICTIEPLQDMLFHNPQALLRPLGGAIQAVGVPTVTVSSLVMAGSLVAFSAVADGAASPAGGDEAAVPIWRRPRFVTGFLLVFLRLVAIPAAFFGIFWVAKTNSSVMGENRLMHLILLVEFAMPTATIMIPLLHQIRLPRTAGYISRLLVWQYAASSVTVSFWTACAITMLY
ncbi:unnamed protein product [Ectocarpus sp. 12 AP-2014]